MIFGFKYNIIIVGFVKAQPQTIKSYVVADNEERAKSIVNQIKMKFWNKEVEENNTVLYVAIQPFRMRDGRESSAATTKIADYNIDNKNEIIDFIESFKLVNSGE